MSDSSVSDPQHLDDTPAPFAAVDIRCALATRPYRLPNYEGEDRALGLLAAELAEAPRNMLQKLAETALDLCHADTAGISLLEEQEGVELFRWEGLAGVFAAARNNTMPRNASPCGVCIDENATQLMYLADRCFPALRSDPRFVEALLIPFSYQGRSVGTVWVVTHRVDRKFDREDERLMRTLAAFASAGWQLWRAQEHQKNLPAMLLQAHEAERTALARELHDDLSQSLVALSMEASALLKSSPELPPEHIREIHNLAKKIGGLADQVHRISHQLHPTILEDLGLESALQEECRSFSQRRGIPVQFKGVDVPRSLPGDADLCLFRVTQECLRNVGETRRRQESSRAPW